MKKIFRVLFIMAMLLSLCSCSFEYSGQDKTVDGVHYQFSRTRKICFASTYTWDENNKNPIINIPDEIEGYKVVSLGGFTGRGLPTPFCIQPSSEILKSGDRECLEDGVTVETIPVTIHCGKNLKEFGYLNMNCYYQTAEHTYLFSVKFEMDEDNKYFKADDNGRLTYSKYCPDYLDDFIYQE